MTTPSSHAMEELVWHPDTVLSLPIWELGKSIIEFVKKDPFRYGIHYARKNVSVQWHPDTVLSLPIW